MILYSPVGAVCLRCACLSVSSACSLRDVAFRLHNVVARASFTWWEGWKRSLLLHMRRIILIFDVLMLWKNPNNKPKLVSLLTQPCEKIDRPFLAIPAILESLCEQGYSAGDWKNSSFCRRWCFLCSPVIGASRSAHALNQNKRGCKMNSGTHLRLGA